MAKLELHNINKIYKTNKGNVIPVKDISLQVDEGEFLTLLGPSGCGKSTMLRLIAGLEQPTHGKVVINGRDVTDVRPGDRNIAMVFQSYALYPHMTVFDNMAASLKLHKVPSEQIRSLVKEVANKLGLENLMERKPSQLSGGQRQRVALGRALVRQPAVFLLDEPLSNLDALLREQVRADLKQLFVAQKAPVVYVTHDQTEAMTLSTKIAVLSEGKLQQLDTPQGIYKHPANQFVASFVGSPQMNLLTLDCQGNYALLGEVKISLPNLPQVPPQIVLGIRPEDVALAQPEDKYRIEGRIYLLENLGMHNLISIRVKGSDSLSIRALLPNNLTWETEEVTVAIRTQSIHWFDSETCVRVASL